MKFNLKHIASRHKTSQAVALCLFLLSWNSLMMQAQQRHPSAASKADNRVYLVHADELYYDQYGNRPDAQIVKGNVSFRHKGASLLCDSAYFYEQSNSFEAFGHVRMFQGDTLSLKSSYAFYDGNSQVAMARRNVILKHRATTLYTDSLDYDRGYGLVYFFEGGKMVDKSSVLTADWGQYSTVTRDAVFYYDVKLKSEQNNIHTDTLFYDTRRRVAHVVGPSKILTDGNLITTNEGFYNTQKGETQLFGRSTIINEHREITGDSLFYDEAKGVGTGYGKVVLKDKKNKNELIADYCYYDEKTGYAVATKNALVKEYSQGPDTLYMHADSLKMLTYHIKTDSVYREMHAYKKVRVYRQDLQAVCDSLVFHTLDSCLTMYHEPIVWNENRQMTGDLIKVYMADSTVRMAKIMGKAFTAEQLKADHAKFNQIAAKEMTSHFVDGKMRRNEACGNVQTVYFEMDDKDSTLIGMNCLETDTMRMFFTAGRRLQKIWTTKFESIMYPVTQLPPGKRFLDGFAWYDGVRPRDKDDVFVWRSPKENKPGSQGHKNQQQATSDIGMDEQVRDNHLKE